MKTNVVINSTATGGKALNKSLTDINPNASDSALYTFATELNALTTNSFGVASRVDKKDLNLPAPTLTLDSSTTNVSSITSATNHYIYVGITYSGDGELSVSRPPITAMPPRYAGARIVEVGGVKKLLIVANNSMGGIAGDNGDAYEPTTVFTVYASETNNFAAASTTFTVVNDLGN